MSKKIIICCLAMVVSFIPLISCSPAIALKDHHQQVQQMLGKSSRTRSYPFPNDPILNLFCANNEDGDYPNPYNCNQIVKCSGRKVNIEACPAYFLIFNPFYDGCVYGPPYQGGYEQCPSWPFVWNDPDNVRCETLGQVPWEDASPVILPKNPREICGRDIDYCKNFNLVKTDQCPEGSGYSKAFFGCLPLDTCESVHEEFGIA